MHLRKPASRLLIKPNRRAFFPSRLGIAGFALLLILTALLLRTWSLGRESVDGDELLSRRIALSPQTLHMVEAWLVHPPLYFFALKATLPIVGSNVIGIRSLSLVCGIASIVVLLAWGVFVPDLRRATCSAAILLTLNTGHIFYSQEARPYAMYCFLVSLLILWALALDRYAQNGWFWPIGLVLMILLLYTHYVGALFIGAIVFSTLMSEAAKVFKIRMVLVAGLASLALAPWLIAEARVYRARGGLADYVAWYGRPTGYDLRAVWARFLGIPPIPGGTIVSLSVGIVLASCALLYCFKYRKGPSARVLGILLSTALFPPLVLFATTLKPLNLTVFADRHLLPSIFPLLVLVSCGIWAIASMTPKRDLLFTFGVISLGVLEMSELTWRARQPARQPYDKIATELKAIDHGSPAYTTWPYGIGAHVNFYLGARRVEPLPSDLATLPGTFFVLYRPASPREQKLAGALFQHYPDAMTQCHYYHSFNPQWGTRLCRVELPQQTQETATGHPDQIAGH